MDEELITPPIDLGGDQDYVFSPEGTEIAYVKNTAELLATSTNNDIWLVNIDGRNARCITKDNWANDNQPVYSNDGKYIAYRAMTLMAAMISLTFLWLWARRATPLALGMSLSWAGASSVMYPFFVVVPSSPPSTNTPMAITATRIARASSPRNINGPNERPEISFMSGCLSPLPVSIAVWRGLST